MNLKPASSRCSHRWIILGAAVAMQLGLGATYAWSAFVDPIRAAAGIGVGSAQVPFTLFYIVFPMTTIFAGGWLARFGPRRMTIAGGVLFGGGWMMAGWGSAHLGWTAVGIGVAGGIGVGLVYLVPIAVAMRWFPERRGLVTGLAVAGFGGGSALVSWGAELMMRVWSPFATLAVFGVSFMALIVGAGMVMAFPDDGRMSDLNPVRAGVILRDRYFLVLYGAMFAGLAAGFMIVANLKQLQGGEALTTAVWAVPAFAAANAAGRVAWGGLSDRMTSRTALSANLLAQGVVLLLAPGLAGNGGGLVALAAMAGFNYGGVLVLYATSVARRWGSGQVGRIYGWLFSSNIPAALAPWVAGAWFDRHGKYDAPLIAVGGLLIVSALLTSRLPAQDENRQST